MAALLDEAVDLGVEEWLRNAILSKAEAHAPYFVDGEDHPEIVFDIELDGFRYTLTRLRCELESPAITLSPREQEIVRLVTRGFVNKAIATVLDISPWTVSTHLRRIFAKLGVGSRAEMVTKVLKEGLLKNGRYPPHTN